MLFGSLIGDQAKSLVSTEIFLEKEKMLVYALKNTVNGKAYDSQHCGDDLNKRCNSRLSNQGNAYLKRAIAKYGYEAFRRDVIAYTSCQAEMDLLERFWISHYQSADRHFGYNLDL